MDTSLWSDDVWVVDSTPVRVRLFPGDGQAQRPAGWAEYGYCASHSRYFWGLRLHLVCTLAGLPVGFALAGAKADEREVLLGMLEAARSGVAASQPGQMLIGDKNYFGRDFEAVLAEREIRLLRPARKGEAPRAGAELFKPLRQIIESVNDTFKGQLDLERHGGHTPERRHRPRPAAHPRPDRRDLAQRHDRPARHAIADRLRPLTLGIIHPGRLRLIPPRLLVPLASRVQVSASSVRRPRSGGCHGVADHAVGAGHGERRAGRSRRAGPAVPGPALPAWLPGASCRSAGR